MQKRNNTKRKTIKYRKKKGGTTFKQMNCSPLVKKKTPVKGSCFTAEALQILKKSYNKHHSDNAISSSNPVNIWKELKEKLKTCSKEDCWLSEIEDDSIRKKIDQQMFAPDHPEEWKKNPDEWLSNFDIMDVLKQYMEKYPNFYAPPPSPIDFDNKPKSMNGGCVSNELCTFDLEKHIKEGKTKFGIVFNLSPHTSGGSHWVSLYIDIDDKFIFYMDSAGNRTPKEIKRFIEIVKGQSNKLSPSIELEYYENYPLEHQMTNTECGMFTLFFLITMLSNETDEKVFNNYMEKIKFFKDKRIPDKYVFRFRKVYFNEK
jgi:hypothetical protein